MSSYIKVFGSKGMLEFTNFNYEVNVLQQAIALIQGSLLHQHRRADHESRTPCHFVNELDHFSHCIIDNKTPKTAGEEGLKDMQHIQSIYRAAGINIG